MTDARPSLLGDRIEQVCKARNLTDRSWSLKAGLSEGYLATQRTRAADDPAFVLPEKSAKKLAQAVQVDAIWLRFGEGAMESGVPPVAAPHPRKTLVDNLARAVSELTAVGDLRAARIAANSLADLLREEPAPEPQSASLPLKRKTGTGS